MLEYLGCSLLTTMNIVYKDQRYNKPQCCYYIQQNISMCNKTETDPSKVHILGPHNTSLNLQNFENCCEV